MPSDLLVLPQSQAALQKPYQASKWLCTQLLIDTQEMACLLADVAPLHVSTYLVSCVCQAGEESVSPSRFLECYDAYIQNIKTGVLPDSANYRHYFSSVWTTVPDALYAIAIGEAQRVVRICKPVVQLQAHNLDYSSVDGKFRPMVFGSNSLTWGIQFSYPQIFQNHSSMQVENVSEGDQFPNTALFRRIQKWVRLNTAPTPFIVEGKVVHATMRLGKKCFSWINNHPQLSHKGLQIQTR